MPSNADEPIGSKDPGTLDRATLAAIVADEIRQIDASNGAVFGILGAWGVGKASLINLTVAALKEEPRIDVVSFNPRMFSGADQLLDAFFTELGAQLKTEVAEVAERYPTGWRPEH